MKMIIIILLQVMRISLTKIVMEIMFGFFIPNSSTMCIHSNISYYSPTYAGWPVLVRTEMCIILRKTIF